MFLGHTKKAPIVCPCYSRGIHDEKNALFAFAGFIAFLFSTATDYGANATNVCHRRPGPHYSELDRRSLDNHDRNLENGFNHRLRIRGIP